MAETSSNLVFRVRHRTLHESDQVNASTKSPPDSCFTSMIGRMTNLGTERKDLDKVEMVRRVLQFATAHATRKSAQTVDNAHMR